MNAHAGRAHSKFSASGAERWMECPGSVALSEGKPDKDTIWSIEGTKAHEVHEAALLGLIENDGVEYLQLPAWFKQTPWSGRSSPTHVEKSHAEMLNYAANSARFIYALFKRSPGAEILVETRVYLDFIHPEMFGTFDGAVIDHWGTLHVFDYKYGAGHSVSPKRNLQMIFYGLGLAHKHKWNFKRVKLWIVQPRIRGYDGPVFWELSIPELRRYEKVLREGVERVLHAQVTYKEGAHCHWCKGKGSCPLKTTKRIDKARAIFSPVIEGNENANKEEIKSEADWRKEKAKRKASDRKKEKEEKENRQEKSETQGDDDFY